ncbi:MAG TPA: hypothetical protein VKP65_14255 [Rhodothermales bacterium]|nr:hypothetical protein [Rhodothermales bacterium]
METLPIETLQIITLIAGVLTLLALGLAIAALNKARRGTGLNSQQRYEATSRELESLREQYKLLAERVDRYDRTYQEIRDDFGSVREDIAQRMQRLEDLAKTTREQQEQIFELREEHKVLMQREDRHERVLQEIQADLNAVSHNGHQ